MRRLKPDPVPDDLIRKILEAGLCAPNGGNFQHGQPVTVHWSMSTAVSTGSFRVWLKDTTSGEWLRITPRLTPVQAVPGQTSYSEDWTINQPVGSYKLWVYYYGSDGSTVLAAAVSSGILNIQPGTYTR